MTRPSLPHRSRPAPGAPPGRARLTSTLRFGPRSLIALVVTICTCAVLVNAGAEASTARSSPPAPQLPPISSGHPIPLGSGPDAIAITPNGTAAYVVNVSSGTVTPIATATNTPGPAIPVGKQPVSIAITPDGQTAYVANGGSGTVTPIAVATNRPGASIAVGRVPQAIAITPNGKAVYVANLLAGTVSAISTVTNRVVATIPVGRQPMAIAITSNSNTAYVANFGSRNVSAIAFAMHGFGLSFRGAHGLRAVALDLYFY